MNKYADYKYYKDIHMGDMSEDEFNKVVIRASAEVQKSISNRDVIGHENEVQLATCSVADILNKIKKLENQKDNLMSEKTIKSESVKDYSRTYETKNIPDIDLQIANQKTKIIEEIRIYLLDTGLMYRGF